MMNNPWKDAAAYEIGDASRYKGRDESIYRFMQILHGGTMAVLTANSGIGKTSFINAGISSRLKEKGYEPIKIRFRGRLSDKGELEKYLIDTLKEGRHWSFKYGDVIEEDILYSCNNTLWGLLHTYDLKSEDGRTIQPLIIFDQFEEVFYNKTSDKLEQDYIDLRGLFELIQTLSISSLPDEVNRNLYELEENGCYVNIDTQHRFKVVFSLRKEFLSDFDYWTNERFSVPELLQNRMLLMPLSREQALKVIREQPLEDNPNQYVTTLNDVADLILHNISLTDNEDGVNPLILSIVCSKLYDYATQKNLSAIGEKDIEGQLTVETCIMDFYTESVNKIIFKKRTITKLEDALVDIYEKRRRHPRFEDLSADVKDYINELDAAHIVRQDKYGGHIYVELIHDKVAEAVVSKKEEERRMRKLRLRVNGIALFIIGIIIYFIALTAVTPKTVVLEGEITGDTLYDDVYYSFPQEGVHLDHCKIYGQPFLNNRQLKKLYISNTSDEDFMSWTCNGLQVLFLELDSLKNIGSFFRYYLPINLKRFSVKIKDSCSSLNLDELFKALDINKVSCIDLCDDYLDNYYYKSHRRKYSLFFDNIDSINQKDVLHDSLFISDYTSTNVSPLSTSKANRIKHLRLERVQEIPDDFLEWSWGGKKDTLELFLPSTKIIGKSAFYNREIPYVYLPNALEIKGAAFQYNSICCGIELPLAQTIGDEAFNENTAVTYLYAPKVKSIGKRAFFYCKSLDYVNLPSLEYLDSAAFAYSSLKKVIMPSVKDIGHDAFVGNSELDTVYISSNMGRKILANPEIYGLPPALECINKDDSIWTFALGRQIIDISWPSDSVKLADLNKKSLDRGTNLRLNITGTFKTLAGINFKEANFKSIRQSLASILSQRELIDATFEYNNAIYSIPSIRRGTTKNDHPQIKLVACNSERMVLMEPVNYTCRIGTDVKEVVLFYPNSYSSILSEHNKIPDVVFLVPHGMRELLPADVNAKELSALETLYYQSTYNYKRYVSAAPLALNSFIETTRWWQLLLFWFLLLLFWYVKHYCKLFSYCHRLKPRIGLLCTLFSFLLYIPITFILLEYYSSCNYNRTSYNYWTPLQIVMILQMSHIYFMRYLTIKNSIYKTLLSTLILFGGMTCFIVPCSMLLYPDLSYVNIIIAIIWATLIVDIFVVPVYINKKSFL